jgi:hypothetical protein
MRDVIKIGSRFQSFGEISATGFNVEKSTTLKIVAAGFSACTYLP